ncbi:MAG: CoA-binding protein [Elusimicrobiota bacterium]
MQQFEKFLQGDKFAVAGSFRKKSKYAYQILLKLLNKNKEVYPVNPAGGKVEGLNVYEKIIDIPGDIDSVSLVTPPAVTEKLVKESKDKGAEYVWMQPGAESKKAIRYCKDNDIEVIYQACLILEA